MAIQTYTNANDYVKKSNGQNSRWTVSQIPKEGSPLKIDDKLIDLCEKIFNTYPSAGLKLSSCYRPTDSGSQHALSTAMDMQVTAGSLTQEQIVIAIENWADIMGIGVYNYTASNELSHRHFHVDVRSGSKQKWYQPNRNDSSRINCTSQGIAGYMSSQGIDPAGGSTGGGTTTRATIKKGSSGADVTYCQTRLKVFYNSSPSSYLDPGSADGIFGQNTHDAVVRFQTRQGLTADGIVGPNTWAKLG